MKKALISPNEPITVVLGNTGFRICETSETAFDVVEPLYWMDCEDYVVADVYYYDTEQNLILEKPIPVLTVTENLDANTANNS